jgi:hypothetical protein
MTGIKEKALALVNEVRAERGYQTLTAIYRDTYMEAEALFRAVEQNEATKQERDDLATALRETAAACAGHVNTILQLRSELADFKQEVSDAATKTVTFLEWCGCGPDHDARKRIAPFIIPKPKPDPLADALLELADAEKNYRWLHDTQGGGHIDTGRAWDKMRRAGDKARAALDALGFEIREKGQ